MNIDGLQELTMTRSASSTKPDTTRCATRLNVLFPPLACVGEFLVDLPERTVTLRPREGFVVRRSLEHRTRAPRSAVILMAENADIIPTGD
jgi:hypothetical protein